MGSRSRSTVAKILSKLVIVRYPKCIVYKVFREGSFFLGSRLDLSFILLELHPTISSWKTSRREDCWPRRTSPSFFLYRSCSIPFLKSEKGGREDFIHSIEIPLMPFTAPQCSLQNESERSPHTHSSFPLSLGASLSPFCDNYICFREHLLPKLSSQPRVPKMDHTNIPTD